MRVGEGAEAPAIATSGDADGKIYKVGLVTPKDFGGHFKLIVHRAMLTNPHNLHAEASTCRLCAVG